MAVITGLMMIDSDCIGDEDILLAGRIASTAKSKTVFQLPVNLQEEFQKAWGLGP